MSLQDSKLSVNTSDNITSRVSSNIKIRSSVDHKFQLPSYDPPVINIDPLYSFLEVGSSTQNEITVGYSKNDAGAPLSIALLKDDTLFQTFDEFGTDPIEDIPSQFGFDSPNNPNFKYEVSFNDSTEVTLGETKYTSTVEHLRGDPKSNSSHGLDARSFDRKNPNAPQDASSDFASDDVFVAGVYPYYYGTASIPVTGQSIQSLISNSDPSLNLVLGDNSADVTLSYESNAEYLWFAHANVYDQKKKWVTNSSEGDIEDGGFIEKSGEHSFSNSNWSNVDYTIYQTTQPENSNEITYQV